MSGDTTPATAVPTGPRDVAVLEAVALAATRDAAIACQPFVGRGDKHSAALGGGMQARRAPRSDAEARALAAAGLEGDRVYGLEDLVAGSAFFVATGVTGGSLLARPRALDGVVMTESLVISERGVRLVQGRSAPEHREVG